MKIFKKSLKIYPDGDEYLYKNLTVNNYLITNQSFMDNTYLINITGFDWVGPDYSNVPVYLGRPYFYGSDPIWIKKINGIIPPITYIFERPLYTIFNIEPHSGKVIRQNKCHQLNIYLNTSVCQAWLEKKYINITIPHEIMWPIIYSRDYKELSNKTINDYAIRFDGVEQLSSKVYYGLTITSGVIFIVSLISLIIGVCNIRREINNTYIHIQ